MKRFSAAILSAVLLFTSLSFTVFAADDSAQNHVGHEYSLSGIMTGEESIDFCGDFYCLTCGEHFFAPVSYSDISMPIMNIIGSLDGVSKEDKVNVRISYSSEKKSFESDATLKVQGATSSTYPKKNYTLTFLKDSGDKDKIKLVDEWGKQSKYCLKANYVDVSMSRNIVSGRIFNQIVKSRDIDDEIGALANGGVVDGYPVLVYNNGDFLGLYTLNIPKDKWMFGMKDETVKQAAVFGSDWNRSAMLCERIADGGNLGDSGWEIEYCSTEDDAQIGTEWVSQSLNDFITFLCENDGESFKRNISKYTDVNRAIDVLIYTYFTLARDNTSKNMGWLTYDGTKWIPTIYDLDGTWGMKWDGTFVYDYDSSSLSSARILVSAVSDSSYARGNLLFTRLLDNFYDEIKARYIELRKDILSYDNIEKQFKLFFDSIPDVVYDAEGKKWTSVPGRENNSYDQIMDFVNVRTKTLDDWFDADIDCKPDSGYAVKINSSEFPFYVYPIPDLTLAPMTFQTAYSSKENTGIPTRDGTGCVAFHVDFNEKINKINVKVSSGEYGRIRAFDNGDYVITDIKSDLVVSVVKKDTETDIIDFYDNVFTDVKDTAWYADAVEFVVTHELFKGTSDNTFSPDMPMTRGMLVTVLHRAEGSPSVDSIENPFNDVLAKKYYYSGVLWCYSKGIVNGISKTSFAPEVDITREQIAAILYRYFTYKAPSHEEFSDNQDLITSFADHKNISSWALNEVNWAANAGIVKGIKENGSLVFKPKKNATRAEVATMLMRLTNHLNSLKGIFS